VAFAIILFGTIYFPFVMEANFGMADDSLAG
jgi:hypothetical protein